MVQRTGSSRRKTRSKLKKSVKTKGKISIRKYLQSFKEGEKVILKAEPAVQDGMYFPRFHGRVAIVEKKQGNCYRLKFKDGGKDKKLIVHPIHLQKCQIQK
tara:strand:- start:515 stop:817 length:303 start_codon:yes stop_codon:yes gene_type:complete